jgi:hypothetical protein
VTRSEALNALPVRNPAITWEVGDNGRVTLTVPLALKPWMRLIRPLIAVPAERQVELDEVGSDVWQWCDGEHTVRELMKTLAAEHQLNAREAEVSLTEFLKTLARRRFLGLRLDLPATRQEEIAKAVAKSSAPGGGSGRRRSKRRR